MSYRVTTLVIAAQLPHTLTNRAAAKQVLLALAAHCHDDGREAYPSLATIAREAYVNRRTVSTHLSALERMGLIVEQRPPGRYQPRTWALNLAAIKALIMGATVAPMIADARVQRATRHGCKKQHFMGATVAPESCNRESYPGILTPPYPPFRGAAHPPRT